jgi:hypothetical protein
LTGIVISYRRADSRWIVGRIYDRLEAQFGRDAVFMDIDGIPLGQDFRVHLKDILDRASVLIAVIGPQWLKDANGVSRLQDETDWVRLEIETALARGIPVIPVLIDETPLPQAAELPGGLRDLAFRQSARVNTDIDFQPNMERLIRVVGEYMGDSTQSGAAAGGAMGGVGVGVAGEGKSAAPAAAGERIAAVAGKLNEFSPIRFVMRWMVAAFLVWLAWQIFFHHSDDKDDEDKDARPSVSAPQTPDPQGAGTPSPGGT